MKKGISLVALVITIIVLVILAGAVVLTMMDDSIFDKANTAVDEQNKKEVFSAVQREVLNVQTENIGLAVGEEFAQKLQTKLNNKYKEANATAIYDETKDEIDIGFKLNKKEYSLILNNKYQLSIVESGNIEGVNDEKVSEILTMYFEGGMELTQAQLLELKKELHIEDAQGDIVEQIGFVVPDEINEFYGIYFPECNRMYNISMDTELTFTYVSEEEIPATYAYAKKINQILTEFETAFVGKLTIDEVQQKYNDGTLNEYILTNCNSIKTVETYWRDYWDKEYRFIDDISFEFNGTTYTDFCDNDTFEFLADESGNIIDVFLGGGA